MSVYNVTEEDLAKAEDQYCSTCKTKKTKYLGILLSSKAVLYKPNCSCSDGFASGGMSEKKLEEHISTPYWLHMGLDLKPKEKAQLKYLKDHNMSWSDYRKASKLGQETTSQGRANFQEHVERYGSRNAPDAKFQRSN